MVSINDYISHGHILTVPKNSHFFYYEFHSQLATTYFALTAIITELTPILLKLILHQNNNSVSNTGVSSLKMAVQSKHVGSN